MYVVKYMDGKDIVYTNCEFIKADSEFVTLINPDMTLTSDDGPALKVTEIKIKSGFVIAIYNTVEVPSIEPAIGKAN